LESCFRTGDRKRIAASAVEHSSILVKCDELAARGCEIEVLPVGPDGIVDLDAIGIQLAKGVDLIAVQWVNSETGVIQPVEEIGRFCKRHGAQLLVDVAQAFGKIPMSLERMPVDYATISAHKISGPQGAGAIYVKNPRDLVPLIVGGSQEGGRRAGTENIPAIAGFGVAAEYRHTELDVAIEQMKQARDSFEKKIIKSVDARIIGDGVGRVCNTTNIAFFGVDGEAFVACLDQEGVRCSQGSACTSQIPEPSHVLIAMGINTEVAFSSVRFSFSPSHTEEEIQRAASIVSEVATRLNGTLPGSTREATYMEAVN